MAKRPALPVFVIFRGSGYHIQSLKDAGEAVRVILEHGNTPDIPLFLLLELAEIDSSAVDIMVELVVAGLVKSGLWSSTYLLVLPTQPEQDTSSLRGGLGSLYEGGVHLQALLSSPLLPEELQNSTSNAIVHTVDILPTLLEASSSPQALPLPPNDGISQWITLTDTSLPSVTLANPVREMVILGLDINKRSGAVREGDLKLIVNPLGWPSWEPSLEEEKQGNATELDLSLCSEKDVEYAGHGIRANRVNNVESADACQAHCQKREECRFWTWNSGSYPVLKNTCWLKASNVGRQVGRLTF